MNIINKFQLPKDCLDLRSQREKIGGFSFQLQILANLVQLDHFLRLQHQQVPVGHQLEGLAGLGRQADGERAIRQQVLL
jgi:hypothetical protein